MSNDNAEIVPFEHRGEAMPVMTIDHAIRRRAEMMKFTTDVLREGMDFGVIPGTGQKPTLLKPGAEKLCSFFGLQVDLSVADKMEDWTAGIFYYRYRCTILRDGVPLAVAEGSCNSKEKKYRYRKSDRTCPTCQKATIFKSKNPRDGYYCWSKKGGCGATFKNGDRAIEDQPIGDVENTEPFDLINTIQKMAQKRAHVAATLIAVNASEFFTQDMEDYARPVENTDQAPASETLNGIQVHKPTFADGLEQKLGAEKEPGSEEASLELCKECHAIATEIWGGGWTTDAETEMIETLTKGAAKRIESLTQAEALKLRESLKRGLEQMKNEEAAAATGVDQWGN